ncbi:acyltransferase-domain-containing protein [Acephala macrosclerotiorum]|nr:acyltransferase-domain-containing protein [Acephala macrosclerotiorum]
MEIVLTALLFAVGIVLFSLIFSRVLLKFPNPLRFNLFLAYVGVTIFLSAIYSSVALCIFTLLGRHDLAQHTTSRLWWHITAPLVGIKLEIEGEEKLRGWGGTSSQGPAVFVINHQSEIDVLIASRLWQPHTVSCAVWRVRKMPVFGLYVRLYRTIFVDPPASSGLTNKKIILDAAEMLRRENMNLVIFPEGVRSYSKKAELLPFKRGAVAIAMEAGNLPLVPIVVANCAHVFHVPEKHFGSGTIRVNVLDPVSTNLKEGETKEDAMLRILGEVREKTLVTLKEISLL